MDLLLSKIKELMNAKGLTIFKLTELSGLSENTIYNWYNKGSEPSIHALKAICPFLDVSLAFLLAEDENDIKTYQEIDLIKYFRNLSEDKKGALLNLIKTM